MLETDMSKTKIQAESPKDEPTYAHLMPIIEYALEKGCCFDTTWLERPFHATRNGLECDMYGSMSIEEVLAHFELPETIKLGGQNNRCILDKENNIQFCIHNR